MLRWRERVLLFLLAGGLRAWKQALLIVQPDTLLRWHRDLFRRLWTSKSKSKSHKTRGRPPLADDVVDLIQRMAKENRSWGAKRIRGELLKLHIKVSKSTIQRYTRLVRGPGASDQTWATFLRNHASDIWACDFLQTFDVLFRSLFVFVVIELDSRRVVHSAVTRNPSDAWVTQQLRNATPFGEAPSYLIRDHDSKYGASFSRTAAGAGIEELLIPFGAPKANAICEHFLGSLRRECLDFFLLVSEHHLHRTVKEYVRYFNHARPHQGIEQRIPCQSEREDESPTDARIVSHLVLGGLHHHYLWQAPGSESVPRAA